MIELHIDRQLYTPVREIPRPYALMFGRNDLGRGAGFVQGFTWLGEFDLLEAFGDQDGHIESFEGVFCHDLAPLFVVFSESLFLRVVSALAQMPGWRAR